MLIREIFDTAKPIDRRIEKVITYDASNDDLLKQEIQEYVATASIESHFDRLLDQLEYGMSSGENPEVGVWVSGFYGSGKSSFTKYLGFALDPEKTVDGKPFLSMLQNQLNSASLRARLATMAKRFPAVVIMLDLATEQLSGATMAEISSVLYAKVMQWAGYSRDEKIAYLEFMLERDGKLDAFKQRIHEMSGGKDWDEIKNQPLVMKALASRAACEFYPELFPDSKTFNEIKLEERIRENERVTEMLDLIRRRSGLQNVIFVIDEVGQYVASRDELILNLDGLAKNMKTIGRGHAWIIATAQQTLTEDNPQTALNTAKLFKLKDRFPFAIDLEAKDIQEICYTRLLGKSKTGDELLGRLFDKHGPQLRFATRLHNTRYYKSDFEKSTFCKFYPFLPVHFEILLQLLSRLAKTRGGIGLRSAIKVLQDILVDTGSARSRNVRLADAPAGHLANSVVFYDALHKDIEKPFPHIIHGVEKVMRIYGEESIETRVAKSIAVLQILEDFPVSRENVAALMHPAVDSPGLLEQVNAAVDGLLKEKSVPLSELDSSLRFMSDAVIDLDVEKMKHLPKVVEIGSAVNSLLRELFTPPPSVRLMQSRMVSTGIKVYTNGTIAVSLLGEREEIQTHIDLVPEKEYEARKQERLVESTQRSSLNVIFFLGHKDPEVETLAVEMLRCREIHARNRTRAADKDVEEYLRGQIQRAEMLEREIQTRLKRALLAGSFIFRGQHQPASSADAQVTQALHDFLDSAAGQVFHKYAEAAAAADSAAAEHFLKADRLDRIASNDDPLNLIRKSGSTFTVDLQHKAIISIRDYLQQRGQVDGKQLLDDFFAAPYGWSKDTSRYLIAAMLVGSMVTLRVGGQDVMVRGEIAVNALKNTANFGKIGIFLRHGTVDPEMLNRARERLLELTGDNVMPLEDEISKCVMHYFPDMQLEFADLASQLRTLGLSGADRARDLQNNISEILKGDASDATLRLGGEACPFYDDLRWAQELKKAFRNGMESLVRRAAELAQGIKALPNAGLPGELLAGTQMVREELGSYLTRDNFYEFGPQIRQQSENLNGKVAETVSQLLEAERVWLEEQKTRLQRMPEWPRMGQEDAARLSDALDRLTIEADENLAGLQRIINSRYVLSESLARIEAEIRALAQPGEPPENGGGGELELHLPAILSSVDELERILGELASIKAELAAGKKIRIIWR